MLNVGRNYNGWCSMWGNIKAWGCGIIVNGTKETNLKWWTNINRAFDLCRVSNFISSFMKLLQLLLKTIVTIEFITLPNYGLKDDRCQYWQVSNLTGVENQKKAIVTIEFTTLTFVQNTKFHQIWIICRSSSKTMA